MSEVDVLRARFDRMKADGLIDFKMTLGPLGEITLEELCGDINRALDAIDAGEFEDMPLIGDSKRPPPSNTRA